MHGRLTPGSSLAQLKQEAKRWLKALHTGAPEAIARLRAALPQLGTTPTLRDVQHALARELGFTGWTALKEASEMNASPDPMATVVARFLDNACPDHHVRSGSDHLRASSTAMRLLARHPEIATASLAARIVCGDIEGVRTVLAADPAAINRRDGTASQARSGPGSANDLVRTDWGKKGWTPLLYLAFTRIPLASANDNALAIAQLLLDAGADPNAYFMAGDSRYTPLVGVIGEGEENRPAHPHRDELVSLLLARGADPFDIQVLYNIHFRANILWYLQLAYSTTQTRNTSEIWNNPAWPMLDLWGHGNGARWILDLAIEHHDATLAEWALQHGADPNAPPPPIRKRPVPQMSLYEKAVRGGAEEIAALLLQHGTQVTQVLLTPVEQLTAGVFHLGRAAADNIITIHPELLNVPDVLFAAARRNRADVVATLLDIGVPIDITNSQNETALHQAVFADAIGVAQLLLQRGCNPDIVARSYDNTPLGAAVWGRNRAMMELIAPHSHDIWELVYGGQIDRVRELIAEKPERAKAAGGGHTLLMWLAPDDENIAVETARLLLQNGADSLARNTDGMTAADRAERIGMTRLAALLHRAERGESLDEPISVQTFEAMADRLLDAYRTGTPEAMARHHADTWHRREWNAMQRYVLADLGIHHSDSAQFPEITLDDARRAVALDNRFRSWDELVRTISAARDESREITRSPVGAARGESRDSERFVARDWGSVIDAITTRGLTVVHANGAMTDEVLARIAKLPSVESLRLSSSKQLTDEGILSLAGMSQLRHLDIGGTQVTDRGMQALRDLPNLQRLDAGNTRITDAGGAEVAHCRALQRLDLIWTNTGDGVIKALAGMSNFTHLVSGSAASDRGLALLHDIPVYKRWSEQPTSIDLTSPEAEPNMLTLRGVFTDAGMNALIGLDGLFGLWIESQSVSARGLEPLLQLAHLGKLSFGAHDDAMPIIAKMPALRFIGMQDTDASDDGWIALAQSQTIEGIWGRRAHGLRDGGFTALSQMPRLHSIATSFLNVSDEALALLPRFPALRDLMPMDVPDAGYRHIGKCVALEKLRLMYCRDTGDVATTHITELDQLRSYFASYTRATDRTPELLATMRGLQEITFSAMSGLTNSGIAALAKSNSLKDLSVGGSPNVTDDVAKLFGPGVKVRIE